MKGISKWLPKSPQRRISDPFSKRYNHLKKSCAERLASFSRKQKLKGAHFLEFSIVFQAVCLKWKVYPSGFQRPINEQFLIVFRREIFIWTKLALKKRLGFQESKNWDAHLVWSSEYFLKRFDLDERYNQVFSKELSTNNFWSLVVEKFSSEQNLRWRSGSDLKKAKIEGRTIAGVLNSFSSCLFEMKGIPKWFPKTH